MKRISLLVLFLIFSVMLQAQTDTIRPPRPKVGVVMGGGGARGASHIGVLKYIEDMGIPVDYVAGTSMGSIVGGFYAMGYSPDELAQLIAHMDWSAYIGNKIDRPMMSEEMRRRNSTLLVNVPFSLKTFFDKDPNTKFISQLPSAYVNNSSLINLFNDLCVGYQEEMDFNDLPIPFACVATDIVSGNEVVLRNGSVPAAMRASMAIPGVFSPVTIGDMVLVDGGLVNNFPADVLREMGADIIIGIEITAENKVTPDDIKSLPQLLGRLVVNSTSSKRKENRDMCDLYIVPDVSGYGMLSFTPEAIDTLVDRGYKKAATYHDQFLAIKQYIDKEAGHPVTKELRAPKSHNLMDESVLISSINISHASGKESRWLMRKGGLKIGNSYSKNDIEHAISIFRGTGCFDEVTYTVKECDSIHSRETLSDAYALTIDMKSAQPHVVGLGVHYDTEDGAALLLNVGFNAKKFGGSKFNADLRLSYNPKINFTYTYSQLSLANFSLAYDYRNEHFRMVNDSEHAINLRYQQNRISAYISQFHLLNFSTRVGLSYSTTKYDLTSLEESFMDTTYFRTNKLLTPFVNMTYDNLDDAYFAKHGIKASLTGRYHFDMDPLTINLGYVPEPSSSRYFDLSYAFQAYITPGHGKLTIIPQFYGGHVTGKPYYFNLWNVFGGDIAGRHFEDQMPFIGLTGVSSTVDNANILRCDLRYNFYGNHYLTASYNFLAYTGYLFNSGMSLSKVFSFDVQGAGLKYSYNSILGPISLTAQWSRNDDDDLFGAYFSFGYSF